MDKTTERIYQFIERGFDISIDSRQIDKNNIFFALKGPVFDANDYAREALEKGAAIAVVDKKDLPDLPGFVRVKNVLETLQDLARHHRSTLKIPVIGITGTNGKTTTKELISTVLSSKYKSLCTPGNFNNHIGLPLTILKVTPHHQIAVIEMGANHLGEIDLLSSIAQPTCGIITNVGKAHLEGFGSFENIIITKTELYRHIVKKNGLVFVNKDNDILMDHLKDHSRIVSYGKKPDADISGSVVNSQPFLDISFSDNRQNNQQKTEYQIKSKLVGVYNFENIMAAVAIGLHFGVHPNDITTAIESYQPVNSRSQFKETAKNKIIWDAYNANPTSMSLALENFAQTEGSGKVVILGDMLEMGDNSVPEHQAIINQLEKMQLDLIILVGNDFSKCKTASENIKAFETTTEASLWFENNDVTGSTLLVKGSRGIQLENLEKYL
ncbi:MAG: UDP-N-acetylmuramoyl-tripeptide--D-alanyl-D-alanine ligase [Bacteroidales bacterium]|nr:UDP-N-acetylmuramoyl-tripeptide--D-alanyl-D-alanine ligase [Bacteroidales bacterium]